MFLIKDCLPLFEKSRNQSFHHFQMDLNGPNGNTHYRGTHHQHDEVRLIDYARLCEHLSARKIVLLQLFRTALRRLVTITSEQKRLSIVKLLESTLYIGQRRRHNNNNNNNNCRTKYIIWIYLHRRRSSSISLIISHSSKTFRITPTLKSIFHSIEFRMGTAKSSSALAKNLSWQWYRHGIFSNVSCAHLRTATD